MNHNSQSQVFEDLHPLVPKQELPQPLVVELFEQVDRLEKQYKEALAQGDARSAEVIALRIEQAKAQSASDSNLLSMQIEQSERARRGRKPAKGEVAKLTKSLEVLQKQAAKLTQERRSLLARLGNITGQGVPESAFDEVRATDRQLNELGYRKESIELALLDVRKWHEDQKHKAEVTRAREDEARRKSGLKSKEAEVLRLIKQTGEAWQVLITDLKKIANMSSQLQGEPYIGRFDRLAVLSQFEDVLRDKVRIGADNDLHQVQFSFCIPWPEKR